MVTASIVRRWYNVQSQHSAAIALQGSSMQGGRAGRPLGRPYLGKFVTGAVLVIGHQCVTESFTSIGSIATAVLGLLILCGGGLI